MQLDIVSKSMLDLPATLSSWTEFGKYPRRHKPVEGESDLGPWSF